MNICLLNDSFPPAIDGVVNVVMNYARILKEAPDIKANVMVVTPEYPGEQYEGKYPYEVVTYKSVDTTRLANGYRTGNPLAIKAITRIKEFKPDIIHVHCPGASAILGRILRRETGAPIVFTYHTKFDVDIIRAIGEGFLESKVIEAMIENISASDAVWTVSDGAGRSLQSLGFRGEYTVVTNGVDFVKGRIPEETVREVTRDYDLPDGVPVYLFVGRMLKYKGLPIIIDAMKQLYDKGMDYRMVFIGKGADEEEMKRKVQENGLTDRVIFTGAIHDREILRAWNSRADIFLFPSVYDTNGIVVREAAACGLASVLIKDSCAAEGITDGRNGFLIEETADSMAELLFSLGNDLERMHEAGQHAMDEIYISWEDNVRDVYKRYEDICEGIRSGAVSVKADEEHEVFLHAVDGLVRMNEKMSAKKSELEEGMHIWMDGMKSNAAEFLDEIKGIEKYIESGVWKALGSKDNGSEMEN